jgi:hypothetical protein
MDDASEWEEAEAALRYLNGAATNICRTIEGSYTYRTPGYRCSPAESLAESESWVNEDMVVSIEELTELRDQIQKEKKIMRNMFLVYTAFTSPCSQVAVPVVKCINALQKNIRRMILRNKFIKIVAACKKIQTALRRHSAVSKWKKCLSDVPERTVGGLFSSLAEARAKVALQDQDVASLQRALQAEIMDNKRFDTVKGLVFCGNCLRPAAFDNLGIAVSFFESLEFKNYSSPHRAVLIDPLTTSIIQGVERPWTELRFRGTAFCKDNNFRSFMSNHFETLYDDVFH